MRIIIIAIISFLLPLSAFSQSFAKKGDMAYNKDNFTEALQFYLDAAKKEGTSSELYYNIGNAYYRLGNKGKAIVYYERALMLNPQDQDAKDNLEFVNTKIVDKTNVNEVNILEELFNDVMGWQSSNGWAMLSLMLFFLLLVSVVVYIFSTTIVFRKLGFFGGFLLLIGLIFTLVFSFREKNRQTIHEYAVVTVQSITLSTSPRTPKDKSEEAFILNEGTKIKILDSVDNNNGKMIEKWYDVKADDTHRAWIRKDNIEII